ncbi:MAG: rod shape-determining protein RodA [Lentisphaerae bacterium GWF2_45_14]|nr:MAG: rod shape-determining protein RodA [Lentisphaerae bacterium GWF2_45_14]
MLVLSFVGIAFIYSTGQQVGGDAAGLFWVKQVVWFFAGAVMWIMLAFMDYRNFKYWAVPIYILSIIALLAVFLVGVKVYGATRWLQVGGIRLQPSEFAKFAVVIMLSTIVSMRNFDINRFWNLALFGGVALVPFLLILKEPDLGSALVIIPIVVGIAFVSKLRFRLMITGLVLAMTLLSVEIINEKNGYYPLLKNYQKERILVFLDPERDRKDRGWNQLQSELAVGSGGVLGKGYMQGTQNTLGFLPQTVSNTDFIFSVIAEETGFAGSFLIITMYLLLIASALRTALLARDRFGQYIATGIAAALFFHSVVNIGMSVRIMPITGLPLPLISYGGSFMLSTMIYLGLLQSVYARRRRPFSEMEDA